MRILYKGLTGEDVTRWQTFLMGKGYTLVTDGVFCERTDYVTRSWQRSNKLAVDGQVGRASWKMAIIEGFPIVDSNSSSPVPAKKVVGRFPARPAGLAPYVSNEERMQVFGRFSYRAAPVKGDPEAIRITDDWEDRHIVKASVPALYAAGLHSKAYVSCHKDFQPAVERFFTEAHKSGMMRRLIKSYDGLWVPRFVRGSRTTLSNHAWGTAFDLNCDTNPRGHEPAAWGEPGCLYELVALAHECGMWWGGHFSRLDGMHFEKAKKVA